MLFNRFILAAFALGALPFRTLVAGTLVPPIGLNPGDHYRLAFVTSSLHDAIATSIGTYDSFVTSVANSPGSVLQPMATNWLVIGSTASVNAITHIGLTSVPIYGVNGVKIASFSKVLLMRLPGKRSGRTKSTNSTTRTASVWFQASCSKQSSKMTTSPSVQ